MTLQCPTCGGTFPSPEALDAHAKIHVAPTIPAFRCAACNVSFETQTEFQRHMQGHGM